MRMRHVVKKEKRANIYAACLVITGLTNTACMVAHGYVLCVLHVMQGATFKDEAGEPFVQIAAMTFHVS